MGKAYAIVVGLVLLAVGIIGFVEGDKMMMGLHFNLIHNCIHVVSGLVGSRRDWRADKKVDALSRRCLAWCTRS